MVWTKATDFFLFDYWLANLPHRPVIEIYARKKNGNGTNGCWFVSLSTMQICFVHYFVAIVKIIFFLHNFCVISMESNVIYYDPLSIIFSFFFLVGLWIFLCLFSYFFHLSFSVRATTYIHVFRVQFSFVSFFINMCVCGALKCWRENRFFFVSSGQKILIAIMFADEFNCIEWFFISTLLYISQLFLCWLNFLLRLSLLIFYKEEEK